MNVESDTGYTALFHPDFVFVFVFATQLRYKIREIVTAAAAPGYITLYHPQAGDHDCGLNDGGDLDHLDCCT